MMLTEAQQEELNRMLMGDDNLLEELVYDTPDFLTQIEETLVDVDEYYDTKDYIFECDDGRYFCLTVTQHSSMGDVESTYFQQVYPKTIEKTIYIPQEVD